MPSPWLEVPLADYEGHMAHVGQAALLDRVLREALAALEPRSIAVLGAAGGNGFEHLSETPLDRCVAVDINPDYLDELERRYAGRVAGLEVICGDLADPALDFDPVDYVHAALIVEYVNPVALLRRTAGWPNPGGWLGVVLQLPGGGSVSPSPFASLQRLGPGMALCDPENFRRMAEAAGFAFMAQQVDALPGGKQFLAARFGLKRQGQKG